MPFDQAPVVQRADNFIHWIGRFTADKMSARIALLPYNLCIKQKRLSNLCMGLCENLAKSFRWSTFYPLYSNLSTG